MTVLVVDDEVDLASALSLYLERVGYHVRVCYSAGQAKALLASGVTDFDLALVDHQLGDESGSDLTILLLRRIPTLRVALMSGLPLDPEDLPQVTPHRLVFLQKPFRPADVAACLRELARAGTSP
ncbi:MAG: response regulator [Bryobacterales bacterium]|jgi:DNA-binding response OmpR family regulator|nr:response regulator [Bryobacterales bacterium]